MMPQADSAMTFSTHWQASASSTPARSMPIARSGRLHHRHLHRRRGADSLVARHFGFDVDRRARLHLLRGIDSCRRRNAPSTYAVQRTAGLAFTNCFNARFVLHLVGANSTRSLPALLLHLRIQKHDSGDRCAAEPRPRLLRESCSRKPGRRCNRRCRPSGRAGPERG